MRAFPQLETGALGQFPIRKLRRMRTVRNPAADGREYKYADPAAAIQEWALEYNELTDREAQTLSEFFASVEGSLLGFTFLDPTANLLAWSDRLDENVWERDPMLLLAGGTTDPNGGTKAWTVANSGAASQGIWQTLAAPSRYTYCLSAYARAAEATNLTLSIGERQTERIAGPNWSRISASAMDNLEGDSIRFGIQAPPGATVELYGIQAEPQAGASVYKPSTHCGVYPGTRFRDDELRITATGTNRHACRVKIIHANHL